MNSIRKEQGFTMIEMLLVLFTVSLCCIIFSLLMKLVVRQGKPAYEGEDAIALRQLQLMLAQAEQIEGSDQTLTFYYHNDVFQLIQYEDKLIKKEGFEVIMQGLDSFYFYWQKECVGLAYERNGIRNKTLLACE